MISLEHGFPHVFNNTQLQRPGHLFARLCDGCAIAGIYQGLMGPYSGKARVAQPLETVVTSLHIRTQDTEQSYSRYNEYTMRSHARPRRGISSKVLVNSWRCTDQRCVAHLYTASFINPGGLGSLQGQSPGIANGFSHAS